MPGQDSLSPSTLLDVDHTGINTDYEADFITVDEGEQNEAPTSKREHDQFAGLDRCSLLQAVVFIEDAYKYRSISHKIEAPMLRLYRKYFSWPVAIFRYVVIFVLHILVIFEYPSSLTETSDMRNRGNRVMVPCWLTESIELMCLLLLLADTGTRSYLMGRQYYWRHKWIVASCVILFLSLIDWTVSASLGCHEYVRFRRMLRPFFILQNSSLMKKTVNCLRRTLPEIASVLLLLGIHLYVFTLFGMLLFPKIMSPSIHSAKNRTGDGSLNQDDASINYTDITQNATIGKEGSKYFRTLLDSFMSLLVLLTTANNPDVTIPAYQQNRVFALFFIVFLIIGLYCFMNMLTAVIYNQFRGYFLDSMQSSFFRRRLGVRAAFEVLRRRKLAFRHHSSLGTVSVGINGVIVKELVETAHLSKSVRQALLAEIAKRPDGNYSATQFQELFDELQKETNHRQKPNVRWFENPRLRAVQKVFVHRYFSYFGSVIACINVVLISVQLATRYDEAFSSSHSLLRIINFGFVIYYVVEQCLKFVSMGYKRYLWERGNIFDAVITVLLVIGEVCTAAMYGLPYFPGKEVSDVKLWNFVRIINILIMVRLIRVIPQIKAMSIIASTLVDLVKNMKAFAGILVVIYYTFAIFGMELFHDVIKYDATNLTKGAKPVYDCGTYQQLGYWPNNFDDFAAALVVLWDVMVVNNWFVFLVAYRNATSAWSYLFFIAWWLLAVVIVLNLFTALILENFIMKWDKSLQHRERSASGNIEESSHLMSVHDMFRGLLQEPAESELLVELNQHQYLQLDR